MSPTWQESPEVPILIPFTSQTNAGGVGTAVTIKVKGCVVELVALVAVIMKLDIPVEVGVPLSVPVEVSKLSPAGRVGVMA